MPELRDVFEMVRTRTDPVPDAWEEQERRQRRFLRTRKLAAIGLVAALVAIGVGAVWAGRDTGGVTPGHHAAGTPVPTTNIGTVTITGAGCTLDGDVTLGTGPFTLTFRNATAFDLDLWMFRIPSDRQFGRMLASVRREYKNPGYKLEVLLNDLDIQSQTAVGGHDSLESSGWLDPGTYGIRCGGGNLVRPGVRNGYRPTDFIGPIDVR